MNIALGSAVLCNMVEESSVSPCVKVQVEISETLADLKQFVTKKRKES